MSSRPTDTTLVPSLLDRLLADRRGKRTLRHIRDFVAQDLEDLLNTRCRCQKIPEELGELATSVISYGLPDFTGVKMTNAEQHAQLRRLVEDTIRRFEQRLKSVRVTLVERRDAADASVHFRIEATLDTRPHPEPVVFDSHLEPATTDFTVR